MATYEESAEIGLIAVTTGKDADGIDRKTLGPPRTVFCKVRSATAQEVFEGGRNGLNPAYTFAVNRWEYAGESIVLYENERLNVYRTYIPSVDTIELHAGRKAGV